jgi:hypothetical protein
MARCFGSIICLLVAVLVGCGSDSAGQPSDESAVAADEADTFGICQMLTSEQVATVLADHDGGELVHSGGSMMDGVDSYQCSYTSQANGQYSVMTLVVSVASTPDLLNRIRPSDFLYGENERPEIADGAFINDKLEGELDITVIKGLNKIDLDLMTEDAHSRRQEMIGLATIVAGRL